MKKYLFIATLAAGLMACEQKARELVSNEGAAASESNTTEAQPVSNNAGTEGMAAMKFEQYEYDFGTIKEGDLVNHTFKFTNTGTAPLIIQSATAQCGCTVPQKPDKPITPGQTGEIKVEFNSKGKAGIQSKAITLVANTEPQSTILLLKGTVNADEVSAMQGPLRAK